MRIAARYSHLNGEEFLQVHRPEVWREIQEVIAAVDVSACKIKRSREKRKRGRLLYSPITINQAFKTGFRERQWKERRNAFYVTADPAVLRKVISLAADKQKEAITKAGHAPIMSYNQTDFLKERVAVEVQFGKYAFVAHDLFVKHLSFFTAGVIDVGVEILPMKEMESEMSSGVAYYERDLLNIMRQGRGVPAVPLILVGVASS